MPSLIWSCYERNRSTGEARCRLCYKSLSCRSSSTKGLWDHVKTRHKREYEQMRHNKQAIVVGGPTTSTATATAQVQNMGLELTIANQDDPQMELIRVKAADIHENTAGTSSVLNNQYSLGNSTSSSHRSSHRGMNHQHSRHHPQQPTMYATLAANSSSSDNGTGGGGGGVSSNSPAISHILVWTNPTHIQNNPTYILANLLDDDDVDPLRRQGDLSLAYVVHQKLGASPEPSGCCFSTTMPVNIVLNEFSNLGYRAIGMVSKMPGEVLWTLAKS